MNGNELGRQVARAVICAMSLTEMREVVARVCGRLLVVEVMAHEPFASAMAADPAALEEAAKHGFATGGFVGRA